MSLHDARPLERANDAPFTPEQRRIVDGLERDLATQLGHRPRRLTHSIAVGHETERLARLYGIDPFTARVAGILHDWEKATADPDLVPVARELGLQDDFSEDLSLLAPLLHGAVAERTLRERYPWLSDEVLRAIARHTIGAPDMGPLDMALFVADGIEPGRGSVPALDAQRALVGEVTLFELWWKSFRDGITYVIETGRHLYPGTVAIYNEVVAELARG